MLRILKSFGFILLLLSATSQAEEKKNQLEELFIWKTSEELKLTSQEEIKYTKIIKSLNGKKAELSKKLQDSVSKMADLKTRKEKDKEFAQYRKNLAAYNQISEEEVDQLKVLLGLERLTQYLKIKQELTGRIKSMLANPESEKDSKKLSSPKVIVE